MEDHRLLSLIRIYRYGTRLESDKAIAEVLVAYSKILYAVCYQVLKDKENTQDCLQELNASFIKKDILSRSIAFQQMESKSIENYLCSAAKNRAISYLRKELNNRVSDHWYELEILSKEDEILLERKLELKAAIQKLEPRLQTFTNTWLDCGGKKSLVNDIYKLSDTEYRSMYQKMLRHLNKELLKIRKKS